MTGTEGGPLGDWSAEEAEAERAHEAAEEEAQRRHDEMLDATEEAVVWDPGLG